MLAVFANFFGYVLKFFYSIVGNYGWAIIMFSIVVKALMIPISIKQQRTLKKNEKIQRELKQIQFQYKNDQEKMNREIMALYKREGMRPLSGCISSIVQIILLFSVFLLVRQPLTYMVKMDQDVIHKMEKVVSTQDSNTKNAYKEIEIIQYVNNLENKSIENEKNEISQNEGISNEENTEINDTEQEEDKQEEEFDITQYVNQAKLNMDFFGIDLSQVPNKNLTDIKVLIIPVLYVISSFISIRITTNTSNKKEKEDKKLITDGTEQEEKYNPSEDMNKTMVWMMPIMSVTIAMIAPLGLALYWLMNNVLMIIERLVINKYLKIEEEAEKNA